MNKIRTYEQDTKQLYLEQIMELFNQNDEEVLVIGSGSIAIPVVFPNGDERYVKVTVAMPKLDYDGHLEALDYSQKIEEKARKAEQKRIEKEKKIAQDKALREKKKQQKLERESNKR